MEARDIRTPDGTESGGIEALIREHDMNIQAIYMDQGSLKGAMQADIGSSVNAIAVTIAVVNGDKAVYSLQTNTKKGAGQEHAEYLSTRAVLGAIAGKVENLSLLIYTIKPGGKEFPPCESCLRTVPQIIVQFCREKGIDMNSSFALLSNGAFDLSQEEEVSGEERKKQKSKPAAKKKFGR